MSLETDLLLDRRRLKRRLSFWRVLALVCAAAFVVLLAGRGVRLFGGAGPGTHVARVSITGVMTEDRRLVEAVDALARDRSVPAVLLYVDSPGGTVGAGDSLHAALSRVAAAKPVVAVMAGTAASAGYMISVATDRIFARASTLTGSIGVILETGDASPLLNRIGIDAEAITSGPLKDQPSFIRPLTPEGRAYLHDLVGDMYGQFVAKVAAGRHMDEARVRQLADGRAYTGQQALQLGLVDQIGGEQDARDWLEHEKHVAASTPVRDVRVDHGTWFERTFGSVLGGLLPNWSAVLPLAPGAWAIWQGGGAG